jgi:hypothetical protein
LNYVLAKLISWATTSAEGLSPVVSYPSLVPDQPVPLPEDLNLEAGWNGFYYWMDKSATSDGYDTTGLKPSADVVAQEINFANT